MLIFTPAQFSQRAEMYYQLGQLTAAGLGLVPALEQIHQAPPARSYRFPIQRLLTQLRDGSSLSDALQATGNWLPDLDTALLRAGEQSGRLDACFKVLADYYRERARLVRQVLQDLAYPLFLLHFAVFILPFAQFFTSGDWVRYLEQTLGILLPLYLVVGAGIYALQSRHGESWRAIIEQLLRPVPILGRARRSLALARLCSALEALLSAGVTIIEAWELAAAASGSPALRRTVLAWRSQVDAGVTPAEAVTASGFFPSLFASQYAAGEISGKLDETLIRLRAYYQEEGSRKLHVFSQWVPRAVYLAIVLCIAYKIVTFYANYFNQIGQAGGF